MNVYYFHHQADELLGTASEQFLGKSVKEIKQTILQTLEGHLRAILGKYPAELNEWVKCTTFVLLGVRLASNKYVVAMAATWLQRFIVQPTRRMNIHSLDLFYYRKL